MGDRWCVSVHPHEILGNVPPPPVVNRTMLCVFVCVFSDCSFLSFLANSLICLLDVGSTTEELKGCRSRHDPSSRQQYCTMVNRLNQRHKCERLVGKSPHTLVAYTCLNIKWLNPFLEPFLVFILKSIQIEISFEDFYIGISEFDRHVKGEGRVSTEKVYSLISM